MKNILLITFTILIIQACNAPEKTNTNKTVLDNTTEMKKEQTPDTSQDERWQKIGYDLEKGRPSGLKAGVKAPDFEARDKDGKSIRLSEELGKQPVVLIFYRGQWCPVCTRYLTEFQKGIPKINEKGAKVIGVTLETPDNIEKTIEKSKTGFTIVQDEGGIMSDYKVLFSVTEAYQQRIRDRLDSDIALNNGKTVAQLPVPATYVIGKDGIIKYAQFDLDYKNRASVEDILQHL